MPDFVYIALLFLASELLAYAPWFRANSVAQVVVGFLRFILRQYRPQKDIWVKRDN